MPGLLLWRDRVCGASCGPLALCADAGSAMAVVALFQVLIPHMHACVAVSGACTQLFVLNSLEPV